MRKVKKIIYIFIIILFASFIRKTSYAKTSFKSFNGSPRMEIIVNNNKYDDVKIEIEDYSGLDSAKISFYTYKNGGIGKKITNKNFIKKIQPIYTSDKKTISKYIYTISNSYLNKKTNDLYLTVTDKNNSKCILNTSFRIKSDGKKYTTDYAPRVFDWENKNGKVYCTVKDWGGIKYVKIFDLNSQNPSKVVFQKTNLAKGSTTLEIPLGNFTAKNEIYNLKIITQDNNKDYPQTAVRGVSFSLNYIANKMTSPVKNTKKTVKVSKPANNNAYISNLKIRDDLNIADPYVLKANGIYYIYSTGKDGIRLAKTKDFKTINGLPSVNTNDHKKFEAYWAPEVYYYKNKYYMFYTGHNSKTGPKIMVATATKPEGPFRNDYAINSKVSRPMDATVLFDNNHIYMYTMSQDNQSIYVEELNSSLTKSISKAKKVLSFNSSTNNQSDRKKYWDWHQNEGPFVIKNGSTYFLMYSAGTYKNHTYTIGYATSSSPIGTFTKKTLGSKSSSGTAALLHGSYPTNSKYNSKTNIYGTGHNSIIKVSNNEMYICYHSIVYKNNKFFIRKVQIDRLGVSNGKLYVNGPTTDIQPMISGTNGYYQLDTSKYDVKVGNSSKNSLKDNINYNVENSAKNQNMKGLVSATKTNTNTVTVLINDNHKISDIWLMSIQKGWNGVSVSAIINDKYVLRSVSFGNTGMGKFQIPNISERIKKVEFTFSKKVNLTEVSVYYK